jgi:hypothetical protein
MQFERKVRARMSNSTHQFASAPKPEQKTKMQLPSLKNENI